MKVFASDYDGTLFKNKEITDYDLEMIDKFRDAGNKFGIATGRTIDSISVELEKYNIPFDFLVGINGGVVLNEDREELYLSNFNKEVLPEIMDTLVEENVLYYGINDGYALSRVHVAQDYPDYEFNIELMDLDVLMGNGVKGLYVRHASTDHANDLSLKINERYGKFGIHSFPNFQSVDIGAYGVTKSSGIERILDHFKLNEQTKVFTVGDAYNDAPMIKDFYGFAMDNGVDLLKETSQQVVSSVGEALEKAISL